MSVIDEHLARAMELPGAVGASLVDCTAGLALATAGSVPAGDAEAAATGAAEVLYAASARAPFASARPHDTIEDLIITTVSGYHLLQGVPVPFGNQLVLYLWLDRADGNLAMARRRLADIADDLVRTPPDPPAGSAT
ncbi:hypothetical protein [Micromonospora sp. NPDC049679]|uniref:hypothetical protein n=1 Tax=Micromonospora sp. NPDC049679 TaxID=3155920 RepID=UPI00340EFE88